MFALDEVLGEPCEDANSSTSSRVLDSQPFWTLIIA